MLIAGTDPKHIAAQTRLSITTVKRIKEAENVNIQPVVPVVPVAGVAKRAYTRKIVPPAPKQLFRARLSGIEIELDYTPKKLRFVDGILETE